MKKPSIKALFYVHFTDEEGVKKILESKELWKSSYVSSVYAVAVGGAHVPGVQETSHGRPKNRKSAVLFSTYDYPDLVYPEEVLWEKDKIKLRTVVEIPYRKAVKLLDDSKVWEDLDASFGYQDGVYGYPSKKMPDKKW